MAPHWTYDSTAFTDTGAGYYTGATKGVRWQIRLMIQDTNTNRQLFQDEEVDWQQTLWPNAATAAAALCDILVAKAGSVRSKKVDDLSITYDPMFYRSLAAQLRAQGAGYQVPYAGGISVADKEAVRADTDWVRPAINRNQDNNSQAPTAETPPIQGGSGNPVTSI